MNLQENQFKSFVSDIKKRILKGQYEALKSVNQELISLYWDIGKNIVKKQEEYGWGKSIVQNLSEELQKEFVGMKGFSERNLWSMRNFYIEYQDNLKLQTLSAQIGWSHNVAIFQKCKENLEREFYIKMTIKFGWTYRVLDNHIDNKSYEKYLLNQTNFDKTMVEKYKQQAILAVKDENPSIGIIICKEKKRTTVEYALKDSNQPIGVATYKLTEILPKNFENLLPTAQQISQKLQILLGEERDDK